MKSPADKTIALRFASHPMKKLSHRWQAKLTFPPASAAETVLPIEIADGEGNPVAAGIFEFAGQKLEVVDGRSSIVYSDFIKGKHSVPLWLHRSGIEPVPGGLTFA